MYPVPIIKKQISLINPKTASPSWWNKRELNCLTTRWVFGCWWPLSSCYSLERVCTWGLRVPSCPPTLTHDSDVVFAHLLWTILDTWPPHFHLSLRYCHDFLRVGYFLLQYSSSCRSTEHAVFTVPSSADKSGASHFPSPWVTKFGSRITGQKKITGFQDMFPNLWFLESVGQYKPFFFFLWRCDPTRVMTSSFLRFLDHTQRRTTVGRTPLREWSARRRSINHRLLKLFQDIPFLFSISFPRCPRIISVALTLRLRTRKF